MKYNLREIMTAAWHIFRKEAITFAEALHRAWISAKAAPINAKRIQDTANAAGITEAVKTWAGWKAAGFEVVHGSRALFQVSLIWGSKGDGAAYIASLFGASQVQPVEA